MSAIKRPAAGERGRAKNQIESENEFYDEAIEKQRSNVKTPSEKKPDAKGADPGEIAREIIVESSDEGAPRFRYWGDCWWKWSRGRYAELPETELRAIIVRHLSRGWSHVKREHVANIIEHLRAKLILPSGLSPPTWIGNQPSGYAADECLATVSSIIHLPSLVDNLEPSSIPATPDFFTLTACDFNIDPEAPPPQKLLSFLAELWPSDPESIGTLQEIFGYMLTADTRQQKIFGLFGPPRSGKGTIIRVLSKVIGDRNVAGPKLSSLAGNFGLSQLVGKTLAVVSDARLSSRVDLASVLEHLLSVSGEDPQTIDRKHLPAIHCRLAVRFLIASNELPRLPDASAAIVTRFVLLRLYRTFLGREDIELERKLSAELPGILLWSIEGWKRLRARGYFVQPAAGKEMVSRMTDLASPVMAFVESCCDLEPEGTCAKQTLYENFRGWCVSENIERVPQAQMFGKDLNAAFPQISESRPRAGDEAGRVRCYVGIKLKSCPVTAPAEF